MSAIPKSASVDVVEETAAAAEVAKIYAEIKTTMGIDFVPTVYKTLAVNAPVWTIRLCSNCMRWSIVMQA